MAGANQYLSTHVLTASPYRLHLMVIEGAVRYAALGVEAMESQDREMAHMALSQSRDYVTELIGGLKDEYDQELATRMKQLFFFAYINLAEGERDQDLKKVQDALEVLKLHHDTWTELGVQINGEASTESTPPTPQGKSRAWSA